MRRKPSKPELIRATLVVAISAAAGAAAGPVAAAVAATAAETASLADKLMEQSREAAELRRSVERAVMESVRHLPEEDVLRGLENAFGLMRAHALSGHELFLVEYDPDAAASAVVAAAISAGRTEYRDYSTDPTVQATRLAVEQIYLAMLRLPANRGEVWSGLNDALKRIRTLEEGSAALDRKRARGPRPSLTPDPFFRGMTEALDSLSRLLAIGNTDPVEVRTVAVTGVAGAGKTMLAMQFAALHRETISSVRILDGSSPEALLRSIESEFGESRSIVPMPLTPPIPGGSRDLVIVDGVTSRNDVLGLVPAQGQCRVLVTANCDLSQDYEVLELDGWPNDQEALDYMNEVWRNGSMEGIEELVSELDRNPLALAQAADYCNSLQLTPSQYIDRLQAFPDVVLDAGVAPGYPGTALKAVKLSLDRLDSQNPIAMDLLRVCAQLSPDAIPVSLFRESSMVAIMSHGPPTEDGGRLCNEALRIAEDMFEPARLDAALLALRDARLAPEQTADSIRPHNLVRALARSSSSELVYVTLAASLFVREQDYSLMRPRTGSVHGGHVLSVVMSAQRLGLWGVPIQIMAWSALGSVALYGDDEDFQELASTVLWYADMVRGNSEEEEHLYRESVIAVASGCSTVGRLDDAEELCIGLLDELAPDERHLDYWLIAIADIARGAESRTLARKVLDRLSGDLSGAVGDDADSTRFLLQLHYAAGDYGTGWSETEGSIASTAGWEVRALRASLWALHGNYQEAHDELLQIYEVVREPSDIEGFVDFARIAFELVECCLSLAHHENADRLLSSVETYWPSDFGVYGRFGDVLSARLSAYRGWYWLDQYGFPGANARQCLILAREFLEDAVSRLEVLPRNRQGSLSGALYHLALVRVIDGKPQEALELALRAEEHDTWALGRDHPSTATSSRLVRDLREHMPED